MTPEAPLSEPEEYTDEEGVFDVDPQQEVVSTSYEIASYGADYPVDGLVKRMEQRDIIIPSFDPEYASGDEIKGFQRRFVWSRPQMDRFIESLLLGLPVPGIFLVRDKSNALIVLDGQQRLRTLHAFYKGVHDGREYKLKHVDGQFNGRSYLELEDEDRRRLDDSIIHATVLRQEHPAGSQDAVYSIFERLNTGGSALQPQEIRVALYNGPFMRAISAVNNDPDWRALYGPPSKRFKDHELILRVLALYEKPGSYSRPVKGFLNDYLHANRERSDRESRVLLELFKEACQLLRKTVGTRAFRPVRSLNAAVLDAVMVGTMRRLASGPVTDDQEFVDAYNRLIESDAFGEVTLYSTAAEESVHERLELATQAFADVL